MVDYMQGTKEDMAEFVDFANMVFSMSSGSIDFERLLPKAYSAERNMLATHHLIKEDGHIKAVIDVLPTRLKLGQKSLLAGYIGTVSVHPKSRGKKYMIRLMQEAEAQQRDAGADLLILDGNRHRYQHYGFERAGMKYCFNITADSIRHCCMAKQQTDKEYRFVLLEENDKTLIDVAYGFYQRRKVTARSREDFFLCLSSWEADTYAVLEEDTCIGYLNVSANEKNIFEFELSDIQELPQVICAFMDEIGSDELGMHTGMDETEKIEQLDNMSDYFTVNMSHQIKILNYEKVLAFLMQWKLEMNTGSLQEGSFVLGVCNEETKEQRNYSLKYETGEVSVKQTDCQPDLVLEEKELVKTLTTSYYFHALQKPGSALQKAPAGWFPLPFFLPEADAF